MASDRELLILAEATLRACRSKARNAAFGGWRHGLFDLVNDPLNKITKHLKENPNE